MTNINITKEQADELFKVKLNPNTRDITQWALSGTCYVGPDPMDVLTITKEGAKWVSGVAPSPEAKVEGINEQKEEIQDSYLSDYYNSL